MDWTNNRKFAGLLTRAANAASKHAELSQEITKAFIMRYGCTHSDVDCDALIDPLDCGAGGVPTPAEADGLMLECGAPLIPGGFIE
jgi:hypothetical protein